MTRCTGGEQKALFGGDFVTKSLFISGLLVVSTGCTTQPAVGPAIFIHDRQYLPIPATLTAPVAVDLYQGITWGRAVGVLAQGLQTCNGRLTAIETLKPHPGAL